MSARRVRTAKMEALSARAEVEALANELYDKLNPRSDVKINVSKAECIRRVLVQMPK